MTKTVLKLYLLFSSLISGVEYSKEEFKQNVPESVPLILKTVFSSANSTNVQMYLDGPLHNNDSCEEDILIEKKNLKSKNVTQLSKVEFRFLQ